MQIRANRRVPNGGFPGFSRKRVGWQSFFFGPMILSFACSTNSRNTTADDTDSSTESETETDTGSETDSATFDWDTDQGDYMVQAPHLLVEGDCYRRQWTTWDEENIAVSVVCATSTEPYQASVDLLVFPQGMPAALDQGSYPSVLPDCDDGYVKYSIPYSYEGSFLTLAMTIADNVGDRCNMTLTSWNDSAEIEEGPVSWSNVYQGGGSPAFPYGAIDEQGRIIVASLAPDDVDGDTMDDDNLLHFQIDRFAPDGVHETLLGPVSFPWVEMESTWIMPWLPSATFQDADAITLFAPFTRRFDGDTNPSWDLGLVIAQGTASGDVTAEPRRAWTAPLREGMRSFYHLEAFHRSGDAIAVAVTVPYDSDSADCVTDRLFLLFDTDGGLLLGPVTISSDTHCSDLNTDEFLRIPGLAWDGTNYGYCDLFENGSTKIYRFVMLSEDGEPLGQPAQVFREIPASQQYQYSCNVVPLGEGEFAVVLSSPAVSAVPNILPGIYVTYVTYQPVW